MEILEEVLGWVKRNRERILSTISELVRIPTVNDPPGGNEKPGQEYLRSKVASFLPSEDIDMFEVHNVAGIRENALFFPTIDGKERIYARRPNLVARLRGTGVASLSCSPATWTQCRRMARHGPSSLTL